MEFSSNEKIAIAKVLTVIEDADNIRHSQEEQYLEQITKILNLSKEGVQLYKELTFEQALGSLKEMSRSRKNVAKMMVDDMVLVDNDPHPYEKQYVFAINNSLMSSSPNI